MRLALFIVILFVGCNAPQKDYTVSIISKHHDTGAEKEEIFKFEAPDDTAAFVYGHERFWTEKLVALQFAKEFINYPETWHPIPFFFSVERDGVPINFDKNIAERIVEPTMKYVNETALPALDTIKPFEIKKTETPNVY